jgi:predicted house-cleaning noncanonical NTP pyrophosphatase (MazG superfamily)
MLGHKSIPEIIKAAEKKGGKHLTPSDAAEAISTKYGPTVPEELTQKEIDELADYLVRIYPNPPK